MCLKYKAKRLNNTKAAPPAQRNNDLVRIIVTCYWLVMERRNRFDCDTE